MPSESIKNVGLYDTKTGQWLLLPEARLCKGSPYFSDANPRMRELERELQKDNPNIILRIASRKEMKDANTKG